MQPTNATNGMDPQERARVQVVLLQHWAIMVDQQREQLENATRQIQNLEQRASRLYHDATVLHRMLNETWIEARNNEIVNQRLSDLLTRIFRENPDIFFNYEQHVHGMLAGFTPENPIDLTADEELTDEDTEIDM